MCRCERLRRGINFLGRRRDGGALRFPMRRDDLSRPEDAARKASACRQAGATFKPKAHAAAWLSPGATFKSEKR